MEEKRKPALKVALSSPSEIPLQHTIPENQDVNPEKIHMDKDEKNGALGRTAFQNTCNFNSLPSWLQDNEYLISNHRPPMPSLSACFRSIFQIHSETGNIWSHLIGCIVFSGLAIYYLWKPQDVVPLDAKIAFCIFFASLIFCLAMSCIFHIFSCHSEHVDKIFRKMDYSGIAVLIMGSCASWLYCAFYSEFKYMVFYSTPVFFFGAAVIAISFRDTLSGPSRRLHRVVLFTLFGLGAAIPAVHYMISKGFFNSLLYDSSFSCLCLSGSLYLIGGAVYVFRIPECYFPGTFDVWCQSHQILHILIMVAAFVHYCAIYNMLFRRNIEVNVNT